MRQLFREDEHFVCATAIALTRDFLVYGTAAGTVEFFAVHPDEWTMLPGVELESGLASPDAAGH